MSSSRSSLGVAANRKNPSWRSSSLSKNSSPASLSYVVAEPEQGAPLASATSKLPTQIVSVWGAGNVIELDITTGNDSRGHTDTLDLQDARSVTTSVDPAPNAKSSRESSHPVSPSRQAAANTRDTRPPRMTFIEQRTNGWLASATKPKGKEKDISEPLATAPLLAVTGSKPLDASDSKSRTEPDHPAPTSIPSSVDIPPLPSVPSTCVYQIPCNGTQSISDVNRQPSSSSTPRRTDDTSPSAPPSSTSEAEPHPEPGSFDRKQTPTNGSSSPKLDIATSVSDETSSKAVDPAANRSWFGTWFGWSPSTPAHGISATDSNPDMHRTDHDRQGPRHENETQKMKPNSTLQAHSTDPHIGNTSNTMLSETHGDKSQSQDDNQRASELAPTSSSPDNHGTPNPTTDSDATEKPVGRRSSSTGKDTVQSTSQVTSLPETESRTSWWDYIGWKGSPAASPSSSTCITELSKVPTLNANGETRKDSNTGLGVSKLDSISVSGPVNALSQPLSCDDPKVETLSGKGTSGKTTSGGNATALLLSPSTSGTSASAEIVSIPGSGSETKDDQQQSVLPRGSERGHGSDQEGGQQHPGQDRVHVGSTDGGAGVAWYTPWTWYGQSYGSSPGKGDSADISKRGAVVGDQSTKDGDKDKGDEASATANPTETVTIDNKLSVGSENGNEEQRELQVTLHTSSTSTSLTGTMEINPIATTIDTHRSSWLSFFASRASRTLVTKSITGPPDPSTGDVTDAIKVDENGVEVMDIEDDGPPQASPPQKEQVESLKVNEAKEPKATSAPDVIPPSQGLVATLVRGRGKVRGQPRTTEQDDGFSDTSSIKSVVQKSGAVEHNGAAIPLRPDQDGTATTAGSVPSSPSSTTSLVKRASLTLAASTLKPVEGTNNKKSRSPKSVSPAPSPAPSKKLITPAPPPNLILPTWQDTFHTVPRNVVPRPEVGALAKTMQYVSGILFSGGSIRFGSSSSGHGTTDKGKGRASSVERERKDEFANFGKALPRTWDVVDATHSDGQLDKDVLRGCKRVVVIGVHGWFPGAVMRTVIGEPTGTSSKFANMMVQALEEFQDEYGVKVEKITKIPLEGEGTIKLRVEKLYSGLLANQEWINDIHAADAILVATHSQGSIVSTHLLDRLIRDEHIRTAQNSVVVGSFPTAAGMDTAPRHQKICCLSMCGIHLGPLRYLNTTSLFQPYFQYLESPAARELFEFQNTDSEVSKEYVDALRNVLNNGVKTVYVASLNDQVVPIYSGVFTAASHPLILRALYIDGDAYHSSDFLANLLVLLLRILNSGIPDSGLLAHLSEATAGSLNGVGHSTAYEEVATYSLAVKYLLLTDDGLEEHPDLLLEPFNARQEQNDYEIPWALRDVIADERVAHFFPKEIIQLRDAFREWHPRTSILRDLKRKLQPIQRLPGSFASSRL